MGRATNQFDGCSRRLCTRFCYRGYLGILASSNLPILKWPGIAIIEIVRSGPLICWLYFAMYLLPDVADPLFTNPEDFDNILRMMAIFSIFGGCYIAEVIRGGLQAVDKGQKEAAVALGLSPYKQNSKLNCLMLLGQHYLQ